MSARAKRSLRRETSTPAAEERSSKKRRIEAREDADQEPPRTRRTASQPRLSVARVTRSSSRLRGGSSDSETPQEAPSAVRARKFAPRPSIVREEDERTPRAMMSKSRPRGSIASDRFPPNFRISSPGMPLTLERRAEMLHEVAGNVLLEYIKFADATETHTEKRRINWRKLQGVRITLLDRESPMFLDLEEVIGGLTSSRKQLLLKESPMLQTDLLLSNLVSFLHVIMDFARTAGGDEGAKVSQESLERTMRNAWEKFWQVVVGDSMKGSDAMAMWLDFATQIYLFAALSNDLTKLDLNDFIPERAFETIALRNHQLGLSDRNVKQGIKYWKEISDARKQMLRDDDVSELRDEFPYEAFREEMVHFVTQTIRSRRELGFSPRQIDAVIDGENLNVDSDDLKSEVVASELDSELETGTDAATESESGTADAESEIRERHDGGDRVEESQEPDEREADRDVDDFVDDDILREVAGSMEAETREAAQESQSAGLTAADDPDSMMIVKASSRSRPLWDVTALQNRLPKFNARHSQAVQIAFDSDGDDTPPSKGRPSALDKGKQRAVQSPSARKSAVIESTGLRKKDLDVFSKAVSLARRGDTHLFTSVSLRGKLTGAAKLDEQERPRAASRELPPPSRQGAVEDSRSRSSAKAISVPEAALDEDVDEEEEEEEAKEEEKEEANGASPLRNEQSALASAQAKRVDSEREASDIQRSPDRRVQNMAEDDSDDEDLASPHSRGSAGQIQSHYDADVDFDDGRGSDAGGGFDAGGDFDAGGEFNDADANDDGGLYDYADEVPEPAEPYEHGSSPRRGGGTDSLPPANNADALMRAPPTQRNAIRKKVPRGNSFASDDDTTASEGAGRSRPPDTIPQRRLVSSGSADALRRRRSGSSSARGGGPTTSQPRPAERKRTQATSSARQNRREGSDQADDLPDGDFPSTPDLTPRPRPRPRAGKERARNAREDRDRPGDGYPIDPLMVDEDGSELVPDPKMRSRNGSRLYSEQSTQKNGQVYIYSRRGSGRRIWTPEESNLLYRTIQKCWHREPYPLRVVDELHGIQGSESRILAEDNKQKTKDKIISMVETRLNRGLPVVGNVRRFAPVKSAERQEWDEEVGSLIKGQNGRPRQYKGTTVRMSRSERARIAARGSSEEEEDELETEADDPQSDEVAPPAGARSRPQKQTTRARPMGKRSQGPPDVGKPPGIRKGKGSADDDDEVDDVDIVGDSEEEEIVVNKRRSKPAEEEQEEKEEVEYPDRAKQGTELDESEQEDVDELEHESEEDMTGTQVQKEAQRGVLERQLLKSLSPEV